MTAPLHILQWNCRSINTGLPHLQNYLKDNPDINILMLQSLNIIRNKLPNLSGFLYPPTYALERNRVMVATYVSTKLQHSASDSPAPNVDCRLSHATIKVHTKSGKDLNLVNVYYPSSSKWADHTNWLKDLDPNSSWIVAGDFNSHNKLWDLEAADTSDLHLAESIDSSKLLVLNSGLPTRLGQTGQRDTAPDITLISPDLAMDAEWTLGTDHLQSDHLPIHIRTHPQLPEEEPDKTPTYQYHKANWTHFQTQLTALCTDPSNSPQHEDIETYYENIRSIILRAADDTIPKKAPSSKRTTQSTAIWWNDNCTAATSAKRKALRKYQTDRAASNKTALREATAACTTALEEAKKDYWEEFCQEEIRDVQDTGKLWKKLKKLRCSFRSPEQPLTHNGTSTRTYLEKANVLAESFARASQSTHLPPEEQQRRKTAEANFTTPNIDDNTSPFNSDITATEVEEVIRDLTTKSKATGPDPISYHMLKHFSQPAIIMLQEFLQTCWEKGVIPKAWKTAEIVGIKKEGKPASLASSYRPIALTPHLGKLYERILKDRLQHHLDHNNILPYFQAGFRTGRSCMEHVHTLLEDIKDHNCKTRKHITTAAFFDIKKAFDCVWHGKLLEKAKAIGISGRLLNFLQTFLHQREIAVKVGAASSTSYAIDMGVPQGSVISPLLFNIMLHDIDVAIPRKGLRTSLYADDLGIWCHHDRTCQPKATKLFQGHIDRIQQYMEDNGFQLSTEKTVFMIFGRGRPDKEGYHIRVKGHTIHPSKEVKFLGVTINQNLNWDTHFNKAITKARRALNALKVLSQQRWSTPRSQLTVARALVRSRLTYGHQVTFTAREDLWNRLQATDLLAVRIALNLPRSTNNTLTYQEAGWLPLKAEFQRLNAFYQVQRHIVPNTNGPDIGAKASARDKAFRRKRETTNNSTKSLQSNTQDLWTACQQTTDNLVTWPQVFPKTWLQQKPEILTTIPGGTTKKENPNILASQAKELLATKYRHHIQLYTDGSIKDNQQTGSAAVVPDLKLAQSAQLNTGVSIFTAELLAILMACHILLEMPNPPIQAAILSDSKSSLQALRRKQNRNRKGLCAEIKHCCHQIITRGTALTLQWIPSHVNIRGNDWADAEAKKAANSGTPIDLLLSSTEMKRKLNSASIQLRDQELKDTCQTKGWLHQPTKAKKLHRGLPRQNIILLTRLRTNSKKGITLKTLCECGHQPTLHHVFDPCLQLARRTAPIKDFAILHSLKPHDFLLPHPTLGLEPCKILSSTIISADITNWF